MAFNGTMNVSLADALIGLDNQRKALAVNLVAKGVTASDTETLDQLVPKVLVIPQEGGSVMSSFPIPFASSEYAEGYRALYAVDDNASNFWSASGNVGQYIGIDFKVPALVSKLFLRDANNRLKDFIFEGANTLPNYSTILNTTLVQNTTEQQFVVPEPAFYRYYRVRCTGPLYTGSNMMMSDIRMEYLY